MTTEIIVYDKYDKKKIYIFNEIFKPECIISGLSYLGKRNDISEIFKFNNLTHNLYKHHTNSYSFITYPKNLSLPEEYNKSYIHFKDTASHYICDLKYLPELINEIAMMNKPNSQDAGHGNWNCTLGCPELHDLGYDDDCEVNQSDPMALQTACGKMGERSVRQSIVEKCCKKPNVVNSNIIQKVTPSTEWSHKYDSLSDAIKDFNDTGCAKTYRNWDWSTWNSIKTGRAFPEKFTNINPYTCTNDPKNCSPVDHTATFAKAFSYVDKNSCQNGLQWFGTNITNGTIGLLHNTYCNISPTPVPTPAPATKPLCTNGHTKVKNYIPGPKGKSGCEDLSFNDTSCNNSYTPYNAQGHAGYFCRFNLIGDMSVCKPHTPCILPATPPPTPPPAPSPPIPPRPELYDSL